MYFVSKTVKEQLGTYKGADKKEYSNEIPEAMELITFDIKLRKEAKFHTDLRAPSEAVKQFKEGEISLSTYKEKFFRNLEAMQPHIIANILRGKVILCSCGGKHDKHCSSVLIKEFIAKKNHKLVPITKKTFDRKLISL